MTPIRFFLGIFAVFMILTQSCSQTPTEDPAKEKQSTGSDSGMRLGKNYLTDCRKLLLGARKFDSVLLNQVEVDKATAQKAIQAFTDFAFYCASDSASPVYLIKTAQVARAINNIPQAKLALERCIETYPQFRDRPAAIFLLAQLYDETTYLNNEAEAKRLYEEIINDYPKSDWAQSAKGALTFIGKSDDEILKSLKNKMRK